MAILAFKIFISKTTRFCTGPVTLIRSESGALRMSKNFVQGAYKMYTKDSNKIIAYWARKHYTAMTVHTAIDVHIYLHMYKIYRTNYRTKHLRSMPVAICVVIAVMRVVSCLSLGR
jgi:hypothetical protein